VVLPFSFVSARHGRVFLRAAAATSSTWALNARRQRRALEPMVPRPLNRRPVEIDRRCVRWLRARRSRRHAPALSRVPPRVLEIQAGLPARLSAADRGARSPQLSGVVRSRARLGICRGGRGSLPRLGDRLQVVGMPAVVAPALPVVAA
jgi:hypothetical protein